MPFLRLVTLAVAASFFAFSPLASAQLIGLQAPPDDWVHLDPDQDGIYGISTERAFQELLNGRTPARSVIVAVIDSGVDITQEGLQGRLWTNPGEIPGNGVDDDGNGYVDDTHGWNFIGGADGQNVDHDTFEYVREYVRLRGRFENADRASLSGADQADYDYFIRMRDGYREKRDEYANILGMIEMADEMLQPAHRLIAEALNTESYTAEKVQALQAISPELREARDIVLFFLSNNLTAPQLADERSTFYGLVNYSLNPEFEPRHIVGDNYADVTERFYGNPDVHGPDPSHGTGVASVIAARPGNEFGVVGVARDSVFIMAVRAVPNGDERDKDVANAIRYAVDNGAAIINMSFGKPVSPEKSVVDEAIRYATERGVLLVHASGNDAQNIDDIPSYPMRHYDDNAYSSLWMEVGASTAFGEVLAASFSNFGQREVDVFAPGEAVTVLAPGATTTSTQGTSFAAPHVAGLAALLMSYYPELSAADVRRIIIDTAVTTTDSAIPQPGTGDSVSFSSLSAGGGVINVFEAVRAVEAQVLSLR
ncbi:S8 family peptidase [soil metagenome]